MEQCGTVGSVNARRLMASRMATCQKHTYAGCDMRVAVDFVNQIERHQAVEGIPRPLARLPTGQ